MIGWPALRVHPLEILEPEDLGLADLWRVHRGGMAPGPLPFAGGLADQPACVMESFAVMSAAEAALKPVAEGRTG